MVTVDDVLAINPCQPYDNRSVVEALFDGKESSGVDDFVAMDIPDANKIAVILLTGLISENTQDLLKALYISRINKMAAPRLWREANAGDCAAAAHAAQLFKAHKTDVASQRRAAIEEEAAWQLAKLVEAV